MRKKGVRVRIAPSPTGFLHLGGARTALFNWLWARKHNGKFILRIEDTDPVRCKKEFEEDIINSLTWLGLTWDEGPYHQSERLNIYKKYLKKLLDKKQAYLCYCTKEELESYKQAMASLEILPSFEEWCKQKKPGPGRSPVIFLKIPRTKVKINDLIRGEVKFDTSLMSDIIIAKGLNSPLYNLTVVIDDYEMGITQVIRGEDHLPNTPKQIILQKYLGFSTPNYAHLPLLLSSKGKKLSKREMPVSIRNYREQGYLKEALINFMAFLGWHPKDEKYVLSIEELIEKFDLADVQKSGAIVDLEKLNWFNSKYISKLSIQELFNRLIPYIPKSWLKNKSKLLKIIKLEQSRLKKLSDFKQLVSFFYQLPDYDAKLLIWKDSSVESILTNLYLIKNCFAQIRLKDFKIEVLELLVNEIANQQGRGETFWPLRVAVSGLASSPPPLEIIDILGKSETIHRIKQAIDKLERYFKT